MSVDPARVLLVQSLPARGCPAPLLGHSRWLGSPGALCVCVCVAQELQTRGCARSRSLCAPSGERLGPGSGARLRQFTPSSTRWHSHPGALPAAAVSQTRRARLQQPGIPPHTSSLAAPRAGLRSPRPGQPALLLPGHCQRTASTHRRLPLTRRKKTGMILPKLLEISFYQALTLICLLSYQAPVKVRFSLLEFMPVYNPSFNKALYSRCLCFKHEFKCLQ